MKLKFSKCGVKSNRQILVYTTFVSKYYAFRHSKWQVCSFNRTSVVYAIDRYYLLSNYDNLRETRGIK